jgi:murein DD-endopeptidase MepM/ murein hydrolase activator NlpD
MKKLYYFSKQKLQFIEITNYKRKIVLSFAVLLLLVSSVFTGGYHVILSLLNPSYTITSIKEENRLLKEKLDEMVNLYSDLNKELLTLSNRNNELRIAANLPPVSDEERMLGTGGGYFDNRFDFLKQPSELKLRDALSYVNDITKSIEFEKSLFKKISSRLKENEKLYQALPAIKPAEGVVGIYGFGHRNHPILKINRLHEGIDIIADVGTKVIASGDGIVEFVGYRGGYGLTVEINHGFGYRSLYAHLSSVAIKEGKRVKRGDEIAKTGNTGLSTGPHLHYEVSHEGVKLNPSEFFFDDLNFFDITY